MAGFLAAIAPVLKAIFEALFPLILAKMGDTAEDGAGLDEEDVALAKRLKEDGW